MLRFAPFLNPIHAVCLLLCASWLSLAEATLADTPSAEISLDGEWFFAIDPLRRGEEHHWNLPPDGWTGEQSLELKGWDKAVAPHDYLSDPRYEWTGVAWYQRSVSVPKLAAGEVCLLRFGRVASRCEVWVNGKPAGAHVGGYSAFEFDITPHVKAGTHSHLAVKVDNSWEIGDIPGPRLGPEPNHQMYVWRNYGGLLRSASLVVVPAVYVTNQKVETRELPSSGGVEVITKVFLRNGSKTDRSVTLNVSVGKVGDNDAAAKPLVKSAPVEVKIPAGGVTIAMLTATLPPVAVRKWSVDAPNLYACRATVTETGGGSEHRHIANFGIRSLTIADGRLLLNAEPVRLTGANRVEGHPKFGGLEPAEVVDLDLKLMKQAHLEFQRLQHYPPSEAMLDWADRHGMLIISEAPCWGLTPAELRDERYRENFRRQLIEMIEASWNHPCVVGWSVGNEYHGWTPEGAEWTKTFVELSRQLDPTRPTTYAALGYDISQPAANKESRGMHWVDFISVNLYSSGKSSGAAVDRIHSLWPEKPILISEYGQRTDQSTEAARIKHFRDMLAAVRARDFVMGLSYWSFNDYRSRYPGGDLSGHRPWGIVTADRTPRELYNVMERELSPAGLTISQESPLQVRVTARSDFPQMPLRGYSLEVLNAGGEVVDCIALPEIALGAEHNVDCGPIVAAKVRLVSATGFTRAETTLAHSTDSPQHAAE